MPDATKYRADADFRLSVLSLAIVVIALPLGIVLSTNRTTLQSNASKLPSNSHVSSPANSENCQIAGCNNELCLDPNQAPDTTACVWKAEYICLSKSRCERQQTGQCGWTGTPEFRACMAKFKEVPNPTTEPTCGNGICEAGEAMVLKPEACGDSTGPNCTDVPGSCPTDCETPPTPPDQNPSSTPKPNISPPKEDPLKACLQSGGTWQTFPDSCAATCTTMSQPTACLDIITESCLCPAGCWDGTKCVNPPNQAQTSNQPPSITTLNLPDGVVDRFYTAKITAEDFNADDSLTVIATGLPPGLSLNSCSQQVLNLGKPKVVISCSLDGTPAKSGTYSVGITVEDSFENTTNKTIRFEIHSGSTYWIEVLRRWFSL
jgi:hypothetical protein